MQQGILKERGDLPKILGKVPQRGGFSRNEGKPYKCNRNIFGDGGLALSHTSCSYCFPTLILHPATTSYTSNIKNGRKMGNRQY